MNELSTYYKKKIKLLSSLLLNLKKEEEYLSYGDADSAVKLEFKNEPILNQLEALDRETLENQSTVGVSEEEIQLSENVFHLLDEARSIQLRVQHLMEKEMLSSKKEYYEFQVKRKLKSHFYQNSGLSWIKNYC
ncbi:MAG: flagellar protein FlgN [Leptospira sp.]|nr:flagellar protein FlgN [Leptospira sp.]